ncbi:MULTISPECIES: oxygen-insensitive NADPH nitroreductase [Mammaliicoccus]|uniref:NADPH-dependent oxidoreductase n=1 Tax=Mammaliicoccus vitulinus TaxID=71237 RepID=A0A2T4PVT0_9STAP|nr:MULTISPECIES: oxygen-insensitive NADPH nitroreductase [Mammaliicoccus]HAL10638.1 oxygen-insensitive NADPH nitroreductase [Staphylococcus sp.]PTI30561.1 oxygen-insensitive NADPH nitroreductase [Mammaliicoccus vitulinus]PTI72914.1 oxygen-insensitive NADPH nitroreductase [Mammaliicoccus vitulinus]RIN14008.1 oxygen-insensitive NADPH nitroreductase [Mammaliicoccus vitulinus]RIN25266.1 oxygen-insensitive NADPH nitroreductase [Mammaliicoccus vitulinus]
MKQSVYDLTQQHRSIRQFKDEPLSKETVQKLVEAGQMASTSSYVQAYSIIGVTDPDIKQALKEVSGQQHVVDNGYLFVYVIDYYRHSLINNETKGNMETSFESAEGLLVGTIDVALAAQNVALTAEDMGLGIVYLGSLRNDVERVGEILGLPEHVFPLFGMAVGVPSDDEQGSPKQRLPFEHVFHENQYNSDKTQQLEQIKQYDKEIQDYYQKRTNGKRSESWSEQIRKMMSKKTRPDILEKLNVKGFMKK